MNKRKILFAGITIAIFGAALGLVLANLFEPPYTSKHYRRIERLYVIIGGAGGFLYGASVCTVKQLKEIQDAREEKIIAARRQKELDSQINQNPSIEGQ